MTPQWHLARNRENYGPYSMEQFRQFAAAGYLLPTDMLLQEGAEKWVAASSVSGLFVTAAITAQAVPAAIPPLPDPRASSPAEPPAERRPWNPLAVAWLGLLFTPLWCGILAALNSRRLPLVAPWWRPLALGLGWLAVSVLCGLVVDSLPLDLLLYVGAVGLLWFVDLRPQQQAYARLQAARPGRDASWVWPSVAGAPLAVLSVLGFVVLPLLPLGPREVCERFVEARTAPEMARYTTGNLRPALETLAKLEDQGDMGHFELTGEEPAPPDVGGHLVGFRQTFTQDGRPAQVEGLFHLVRWDGSWKIEDMYLVSVNRQPLARWFSLAADHHLLAAPRRGQVVPVAAERPEKKALTPVAPKGWLHDRKNWTKLVAHGLVFLFLALRALYDKFKERP
jgi:hypothetical protein